MRTGGDVGSLAIAPDTTTFVSTTYTCTALDFGLTVSDAEFGTGRSLPVQ